MRFDPRLYLVTGPVPSGRTIEDVVEAAVAGGVTAVQLRDKTASTAELTALARNLHAIARPYDVPVFVNDDVEAAVRSGVEGVHVGVSDAAASTARAALGPSRLVGWSINELDQIERDAEVLASDYLAASPVWSTPSKTDTPAPFELHGVRRLRDRMPPELPLVAIGGIDATNAAEVIGAGADGVAVISAICAADDPHQAAVRLREAADRALAARKVAP